MADRLASELIDAVGGTKAVAERLNERRGTVDVWRSRQIIPRRAWPDILLAYPEKVGLADLYGTERTKLERDQARQDQVA